MAIIYHNKFDIELLVSPFGHERAIWIYGK